MSLPDEENRRQRLAKALEALRERAGQSRAAAARRMGEDPSFATQIALWERGQASPQFDELWRFLDAVDAHFGHFDLELNPEARNPRLQEIADELETLAKR